MSFKSFEPKKYSRSKHVHWSDLRELCANCGFPFGMHYHTDNGDRCPTEDEIKAKYPGLKPVKH